MPKPGETCTNCGGTIRLRYADDSTLADGVDRVKPNVTCSGCLTPRGASDQQTD